VESDETADTATYSIASRNGGAALVTSDEQTTTLFASRAPAALATFPDGYLAATGILGDQVAAKDVGADLAGLKFISDAVVPFGLSAMDQENYPINKDLLVDPTDPENGYEGWLYDRCATFLSFYIHSGDVRFLEEGDRVCAYYADHIALTGDNAGIFTGKPDPDPKYSHLRGLYAYYALTGDEAALAAGKAIANRFLNNDEFTADYRAGHTIGSDQLWTERLLAVSIEALYYGHRFTGKGAYLKAAEELVATAYRHITGDASALAAINPGSTPFPPQNCFIHNAEQAAEGDADQPWCSGWMPALLVAPLLAYQAQTGDSRVDEIFIRLTRYLRDEGTAYFDDSNGNADDTFLHPAKPSTSPDSENPRMLVPLYGAAIDSNGKRFNGGDYDDYEHCLDASAIAAAGIAALKRSGGYDEHPIGPFASEGASFLALQEELAACARWTLADQARPHRDPSTWTADDLAQGLADPKTFIHDNNIGNVSHNVSPARKISWWFNESLEEFGILRTAGVAVPTLKTGTIEPGDVPPSAFPTAAASPAADSGAAPPAEITAATPVVTSETTAAAVTENGRAATGTGEIVYTLADGTIERIAAKAPATPENISAELDAQSPATPVGASGPLDAWGGASRDGRWLVLLSQRFDPDCAGWACLSVLPADLSSAETIHANGQAIHASGPAAIADGGDLVVYPDADGPHEYDLWTVRRQGDGWSAPILLTAASPYADHGEPAISDDGAEVVFDCGNSQYMVNDTAICEVGVDGSNFRVLLTPDRGPAGSSADAALRHPVFAPDGAILFEADWTVPSVWRLAAGVSSAERVASAFDDDHQPCALPDGRIASLWQGRAGNDQSVHELKVMAPDGSSYAMLVTGADIADATCG
jgi:hypothetical protein